MISNETEKEIGDTEINENITLFNVNQKVKKKEEKEKNMEKWLSLLIIFTLLIIIVYSKRKDKNVDIESSKKQDKQVNKESSIKDDIKSLIKVDNKSSKKSGNEPEIRPEYLDNYLLMTLGPNFSHSLMNDLDIKFLNGMIRKYKPKKILEIGVTHGGSSVIILNAIKDDKDAKLYSVDYREMCFSKDGKRSGHIVLEGYPHLQKKWKLFLGDLVSSFIEEIGKDIDFVLLDSDHFLPGEALNFLQILPFLKEEAVIVIHDVGNYLYDIYSQRTGFLCNNKLMTLIRGKMIVPIENNDNFFNNFNIGAFQLSKNQENYYDSYFYFLWTFWAYIPPKEDIEKLLKHFNKYYDHKYVMMFKNSYEMNKKYEAEVAKSPEFKKKMEKYLIKK